MESQPSSEAGNLDQRLRGVLMRILVVSRLVGRAARSGQARQAHAARQACNGGLSGNARKWQAAHRLDVPSPLMHASSRLPSRRWSCGITTRACRRVRCRAMHRRSGRCGCGGRHPLQHITVAPSQGNKLCVNFVEDGTTTSSASPQPRPTRHRRPTTAGHTVPLRHPPFRYVRGGCCTASRGDSCRILRALHCNESDPLTCPVAGAAVAPPAVLRAPRVRRITGKCRWRGWR